MITLTGLTRQQVQIADLIWNCGTQAEVDQLIRNMPNAYRRDAVTLRELMIAAALDQVEDTQLARRVIQNLG